MSKFKLFSTKNTKENKSSEALIEEGLLVFTDATKLIDQGIQKATADLEESKSEVVRLDDTLKDFKSLIEQSKQEEMVIQNHLTDLITKAKKAKINITTILGNF